MDERRLWVALPGRMPGLVPSVIAALVDAPLHEVVITLERMVAAGRVIRRFRKGHDVYYRGYWPDEPNPPDLTLF